MNTPINDFIDEYILRGDLRCHMPGHKGKYGAVSQRDITEISGADSLFEADGIIARSEKLMAELYGSAECSYSAGGSTLCIQAMLYIMKLEHRRVIAFRNVHRSFLSGCALLDIEPEWILPEYTNGILSGVLSVEKAEEKLRSGAPACLYVTSPDYTGRTADIRALAEVCRKYGARLIVDNAHGAHLAFLPVNIHPIHLGADLCCDSAHKMLPALTGAAMLHAGEEHHGLLKRAMSLFGSTSPSYLILGSLDMCIGYISEEIHRDMAQTLPRLKALRERFTGKLVFSESEPFHITIDAVKSGFDGRVFGELLRKNGCEPEYCGKGCVILLMSPVCRNEEINRLGNIIDAVLRDIPRCDTSPEAVPVTLPERALSLREAVMSPQEEIPVEAAVGRICGAVNVPCPPAVPIAVSGEIISRECVNIFKSYGIPSVFVVK